jgi:uncharacterized protein YbjQ (UPF0145 family)
MKKTTKMTRWALAALLAVPATHAFAADKEYHLSFADLMASAEAQQKLDGSVRLYLQGQKTPKVLEKKGEDVSNKKTNAFGKEAVATCQWAALSALIALQDKAKRLGGNAVVNIVSFYKRDAFASATEYECHVGNLMSGVAFKGTIAKIAP